MSDQEFREKVIDGLARLETKVDAFATIDSRVGSLERSRERDRGIMAGISLAVSVAFAAIKAIIWSR